MQKRLQMPGESIDARAVRTRDQIGMALIELAREKSYDDITVQDIAQRARVSRTTFYAHFQDRDGIMVRYSVVFGEYLGRQLRQCPVDLQVDRQLAGPADEVEVLAQRPDEPGDGEVGRLEVVDERAQLAKPFAFRR